MHFFIFFSNWIFNVITHHSMSGTYATFYGTCTILIIIIQKKKSKWAKNASRVTLCLQSLCVFLMWYGKRGICFILHFVSSHTYIQTQLSKHREWKKIKIKCKACINIHINRNFFGTFIETVFCELRQQRRNSPVNLHARTFVRLKGLMLLIPI